MLAGTFESRFMGTAAAVFFNVLLLPASAVARADELACGSKKTASSRVPAFLATLWWLCAVAVIVVTMAGISVSHTVLGWPTASPWPTVAVAQGMAFAIVVGPLIGALYCRSKYAVEATLPNAVLLVVGKVALLVQGVALALLAIPCESPASALRFFTPQIGGSNLLWSAVAVGGAAYVSLIATRAAASCSRDTQDTPCRARRVALDVCTVPFAAAVSMSQTYHSSAADERVLMCPARADFGAASVVPDADWSAEAQLQRIFGILALTVYTSVVWHDATSGGGRAVDGFTSVSVIAAACTLTLLRSLSDADAVYRWVTLGSLIVAFLCVVAPAVVGVVSSSRPCGTPTVSSFRLCNATSRLLVSLNMLAAAVTFIATSNTALSPPLLTAGWHGVALAVAPLLVALAAVLWVDFRGRQRLRDAALEDAELDEIRVDDADLDDTEDALGVYSPQRHPLVVRSSSLSSSPESSPRDEAGGLSLDIADDTDVSERSDRHNDMAASSATDADSSIVDAEEQNASPALRPGADDQPQLQQAPKAERDRPKGKRGKRPVARAPLAALPANDAL
jgi:hypothetical protein